MASNNPGEAPESSSGRPKRTRMLSFEPNADFFVIDEHTTPSAAATAAAEPGRRSRQSSHENRVPSAATHELMGPILRRKKVVSMPLGDPRRNDFFAAGDRSGVPVTVGRGAGAVDETATEDGSLGPLPNVAATRPTRRQRQHTAPTSGGFFAIDSSPLTGVASSAPARRSGRKKTNSFVAGLLARRAVLSYLCWCSRHRRIKL